MTSSNTITINYLGSELFKTTLESTDTFITIKEKLLKEHPSFVQNFSFAYLNKNISDSDLITDIIKNRDSTILIEPEIEDFVEKLLVGSEQFGVFATKKIPVGTVLWIIDPINIKSVADRFTLQYDEGLHIDGQELGIAQYLNHSCDPNLYLKYVETSYIDEAGESKKKYKIYLISRKDISQGEQFSFNYLCTEYEMAEVFDCNCGCENCHHKVGGFKLLNEDQKKELKPWLAPYLLKTLE